MPNRRSVLLALAALPVVALPFSARPARAGEATFNVGGVALRGTDPVAYFTEGKAVKGSDEYALMWHGATWYFASAHNMELFMANPRAYAPQYGGYCAYAASQGALAATDPEAYTIRDGKLYLNYSKPVRSLWAQDIPGNIEKADANWPKLMK